MCRILIVVLCCLPLRGLCAQNLYHLKRVGALILCSFDFQGQRDGVFLLGQRSSSRCSARSLLPLYPLPQDVDVQLLDQALDLLKLLLLCLDGLCCHRLLKPGVVC